MIEIEKPKMVTSDVSEDGRYGKFVWEQLERGYGITLATACVVCCCPPCRVLQ